MIHRTSNENSVIAKKYDKAVMDNEFVFDRKRLMKAYNYDSLDYLYDSEMTAVVVCVLKGGKSIALMAYNFTGRTNFKVYKLLGMAYNNFKDFEFICLLENILSLKWCLRFAKKRNMEITYNSNDELVNFRRR